jgi:hypothetical protein
MTWRDGELAGKQRALDLRNEVKEGGGGGDRKSGVFGTVSG